jgi:TolB-like protein/DNA-binding winged helix-turn-helix (wHTH) protein/Flp pilus assembly protein TadD
MTENDILNTDKPLQIGEWSIHPDTDRIQRGDTESKLEPKTMKVLLCLAQHAGKVVSRETLENTVWTNMIVGYDAVSATIIKLRKALGDDSRNPTYIETISKKGYRLIANVTLNVETDRDDTEDKALEDDEPIESSLPLVPQSRERDIKAQLISAIVGLLIIITGWQILDVKRAPQTTEPEKAAESVKEKTPSIVVLPFKNLSNDPQQDYFSEGITDDIITDLSKIGALRVVARQSANHFRNTEASHEEVAIDLGVNYIIEGSIQKSGQRLRINIQLTDVEKGLHLWAERFDRKVEDIFAIQDEIARQITNAMFVTLSDQEAERVMFRTTSNFEAYDSFLRGLQLSGNRNKQSHDATIEAYRRAIELDPNYARAYGALAVIMTRGYRFNWTDLSISDAQDRSLELAKKAVELDQSTPQIYWALSFVHLFRREYEEAEEAALQSVNLSPNYADGYGILAFVSNWRDKPEDAINYINKATELNPYYTYDYPWNLGLAYYSLDQYENAVKNLKKALERNETVLLPRLFLAASYVKLGRQDDAEWEIEQVEIHRPSATLSMLTNTVPFENKTKVNTLIEALRKAGLAE